MFDNEHVIVIVISLTFFFRPPCAVSQNEHDMRTSPTLEESPAVLSLDSGTLTVVLANKNGFVIASDSRRSGPDGHSDDSQKIFRLGPRSAMAIAGFASNTREPFATDVSAAILDALPKENELTISDWIEHDLVWRLQVLWLIAGVERIPPQKLNFYVTVASIGQDAIPQISQMAFQATQKLGGWEYGRPVTSAVKAGSFQYAASGVTTLVDQVMSGRYSGSNPELKDFASALEHKQQDALPVLQMAQAARAFINETSILYSTVGGPIQRGSFQVNGGATWELPALPQRRPFLGSVQVYASNTQEGGSPAPPSDGKPGELVRIVNNGDYSNCHAIVDGNVYVKNHFSNCRIETKNLSPLYWRGNSCSSCVWISSRREYRPLKRAVRSRANSSHNKAVIPPPFPQRCLLTRQPRRAVLGG